MIVAVFSDVHANLPALDTFLAAVRSRANSYLCLGDTVNYGPWNDECLEVIADLPGAIRLAGNHEHLFLDPASVASESSLVRSFSRWSLRFFSRTDLISDLPELVTLGRFRCTHTIDGRRIYPDTDVVLDHDYLIGHSHYQFHSQRGSHSIVNPGSIGQNRHRIDHVEYALYDSDAETFTFESVPYDFAAYIRELRRLDCPDDCLAYYERKALEAIGR